MAMDQRNPDYRNGKPIERRDAVPVLTPEQSRQGITTGRIRWILAISVGLAIVALIVLLAIYA
jgi:hypothetical protein